MRTSLVAAALALFGGAEAFNVQARAGAPPRAGCVSMGAAALRTGDLVKVISGDDKGVSAKVLLLDKKKGQVWVEGVNVRTKHVKPMKEGDSGNLLKKEMPISMSNVKLEEAAPAAAPAAPAEPAAAE